jgi:hypothetical protein
MASRKMTFTLPDELAGQLLKRVPAQDRSRYVSEAIAAKLRERDERLARACEIANHAPDVLAVEQEWDALRDEIAEPWADAAPR